MRLFIYRHHSIGFIFFKFNNICLNINSTNINFFKFSNLAYPMFWINNMIFNFIFSFFSFLLFNFFYFRFNFICF